MYQVFPLMKNKRSASVSIIDKFHMFVLQRNLKDMVIMGLSSKKEKDDRFEKMKKDVAEQIRMRVPSMKAKVRLSHPGVCVLGYWRVPLTCGVPHVLKICVSVSCPFVSVSVLHGIHLLPLPSPTAKIRKRQQKISSIQGDHVGAFPGFKIIFSNVTSWKP